MGTKIWQPSPNIIQESNLLGFIKFVETKTGLKFENYIQLHDWSINSIEEFWALLIQFFNISLKGYHNKVISDEQEMYKKRWFEGAEISYSELIFRNRNDDNPAIIYKSENATTDTISWNYLEQCVSGVANYLKKNGFKKGDAAVAYSTNNPDTIIAFLAVNSLGGIWSSCSPDFGVESVIERFGQIKPKVFFANKTYNYGGKTFDISEKIQQIKNKLGEPLNLLLFESPLWEELKNNNSNQNLEFQRVEFNDPIWVLYSSGTTGKPKAIAHRTGGMVFEHLKALALHQNVKKGEKYCWYSTTGWMMWNYALSSLLTGATLCIYDGSVAYPDMNVLWDFASEYEINHFGGGAAFFQSSMKAQVDISSKSHSIMTLGSTGSPLPEEVFFWLSEKMPRVQIISLSGGTDVCSAFIGGNIMLPVFSGEIQCKMLGASIESWNDEGKLVENEVGELVITKPMPSMPVFFWGDEDFGKYKSSYFEKYPGIWCHGDWIKITKNNGIIVLGRSDATLNRGGVRIGTAEIYNAVDALDFINDSLIVCIEKPNGEYYMPLFIKSNTEVDDKKYKEINQNLRKLYSPRHVPDAIVQAPDIPYTISGKKMEMAVKKILSGIPVEKAAALDAMRNPESLQWYLDFYQSQQ